MLETEKGKRMDQVLASGATREELAEALWCAESSVRMWNECADALRNENAKLRELCADMWRFTGAACKKYPRLFDPAAQGGQMVQLNVLDSFEQRMRELSVEVDG